MWDALKITAAEYPVEDNKDGSFLTMLSKSGFIFGVIHLSLVWFIKAGPRLTPFS